MVEKIYLNLLLLCGILSEGIIGNLADENIKKPSDILIRQKRVINHISSEDNTVITTAPYIVQIKENMRFKCAGSILSHHVIITIPACIQYALSHYHVLSGSTSLSNSGSLHNVTDVRKHLISHPRRPEDGVALLIVAPPFEFGRYTNPIQLNSRRLLPDTLGTVFSWGFNNVQENRATVHPRSLQSIKVPTMDQRDCLNVYRAHNIEISDTDICTYPQRNCGHIDGGAPLVIGQHLAGIHLWSGTNGDQIYDRCPGVFVALQHYEYNMWIRSNLRSIEANFSNHHK